MNKNVQALGLLLGISSSLTAMDATLLRFDEGAQQACNQKLFAIRAAHRTPGRTPEFVQGTLVHGSDNESDTSLPIAAQGEHGAELFHKQVVEELHNQGEGLDGTDVHRNGVLSAPLSMGESEWLLRVEWLVPEPVIQRGIKRTGDPIEDQANKRVRIDQGVQDDEKGKNWQEITEQVRKEELLQHALNGELLKTVAKKSLLDVKRVLDQGAQIESRDAQGRTVLHYAAGHGHYKIVKWLIHKYPVLINVKSTRGVTALDEAVAGGFLRVVKLLLVESPFLMQETKILGWSLLHIAAYKGRTNVVMWLLVEHPSLIQKASPWGVTPLHVAAQKGHLEAVKLLRSLMSKKDALGSTAFHYATRGGWLDVIQWFMQQYPGRIYEKDLLGWTVLHCAADGGYYDIVEWLLKLYAGLIHEKDALDRTALHCAAATGHHDIVRLLLKMRPDLIHEQDVNGDTALHTAVRHGHLEVVRLLVKQYPRGMLRTNACGRTVFGLVTSEDIQKLLLAAVWVLQKWPGMRVASNSLALGLS